MGLSSGHFTVQIKPGFLAGLRFLSYLYAMGGNKASQEEGAHETGDSKEKPHGEGGRGGRERKVERQRERERARGGCGPH